MSSVEAEGWSGGNRARGAACMGSLLRLRGRCIVSRYVVDVEPGRPVRAWVSRAAGRSPEAGGFEGHWGRGGGEQWRMEVDLRSLEVREEVETWMKNPRRLKGSGE